MRVDLRTYGLEPPEKGKTDGAGKSPASELHGSATAGADQARFRFDQKRVHALEAEAMAQPEIREQKVDLLRQAVGKGEYAVSDGQVAEAMLADMAR
jgi:flagellar biosynthesis anti-sigma factor FlgM